MVDVVLSCRDLAPGTGHGSHPRISRDSELWGVRNMGRICPLEFLQDTISTVKNDVRSPHVCLIS